jgi:hypothetical protein
VLGQLGSQVSPERDIVLITLAGIGAEKYSHVKYFPTRAAYDENYDIAVDICEVGVDSLATRIQEMLIDYLREKHGDNLPPTRSPIGAAISGRASMAGCVSPILVKSG